MRIVQRFRPIPWIRPVEDEAMDDEGGGDGRLAPLAAAIQERLAMAEELGGSRGTPGQTGGAGRSKRSARSSRAPAKEIFLSKQNGLKSGLSDWRGERSAFWVNRNITKQTEPNETEGDPLDVDWPGSGVGLAHWHRGCEAFCSEVAPASARSGTSVPQPRRSRGSGGCGSASAAFGRVRGTKVPLQAKARATGERAR